MRTWSGLLVATVAVLALALAGPAVAAPALTELGTGFSTNNGAWDIVEGPDGNLWFTEEAADSVGRITPNGVVAEFSAGLTLGAPEGITVGPDGNLWFALHDGAIGRITTAGVITEYTTGLSSNAKPTDIASGSDGNLWFTEDTPARIGKIDPNTGTITEFTTGLTTGSQPSGIAAGPDGDLWFTEYAGPGAIGSVDPGTGTITEFTAGLTVGAKPLDITAGPDGNLWFTEFEDPGAIGRITPSGAIMEFGAGLTDNAAPSGIAAGPDGALWVTGSANPGLIGRITTSGSVTEYTAGLTANRKPWRIAAGPADTMWFTENGNPGRVARVSGIAIGAGSGGGTWTAPPGPTPFRLPPVPELGSSVVVRPGKGVVRVRRRGAASFVALAGGAELPVGSEVDARRGVIELTSALPDGTTQSGSFGGGRFLIKQSSRSRGRVDLYLRGRVCSRPASRGRNASAARQRVVRRLWGRDRGGRFRTHGRNSHATVRGTRWLVADRCGGTFTRVTRGSVVVRDIVRRKRVVLRVGQSYMARWRR